MPEVLTAYCLKERVKDREMVDPVIKTNAKGKQYVMGKCKVCGSPMAKLGADAVTLATKLGAKKVGGGKRRKHSKGSKRSGKRSSKRSRKSSKRSRKHSRK